MRRDIAQAGHQAADASPRIVISFDFEMMWGMRDVLSPAEAMAAGFEQVRSIVPELLSALTKRNLRATWAIVGALGSADWADYFARAPASPHYANARLEVDEAYAAQDSDGKLHFAPELLDRIHEADGQDLGTHTFSHLMLGEPGVTSTDLEADLGAVAELWVARFGAPPVSLVFPRNQVAFLDVVAESPVRVWRGRERARFDSGDPASREGLPLRIARLVDAVNPITRKAEAPTLRSGMLQTRASLFVRPGLPGALWAAHKRRIAGELRKLDSGEVLHLWLHPHNFVTDSRLRLSRFDEVLDMVAEHVAGTAALSANMADLVAA